MSVDIAIVLAAVPQLLTRLFTSPRRYSASTICGFGVTSIGTSSARAWRITIVTPGDTAFDGLATSASEICSSTFAAATAAFLFSF